MNTFLIKISQLDSICDVILLSSRGEPLFLAKNNVRSLYYNNILSLWNNIIAKLGRPLNAEFLFTRGRYYLQQTDIGYLIIGMRNESDLNKLKIACTSVKEKLANATLRKQTLLKMLMDVDDEIKPHVIKELMSMADRDVAHSLIVLLKKYDQLQPKSRDRLLLIICQALGYCSTYEAIEALESFLTVYTAETTSVTPAIENAVRISVQQLAQSKPPAVFVQQHAVPPQSPHREKKKQTKPAHPKKIFITPDFPEAQQILKLLQHDRQAEAISTILQLITTSSHNKEFQKAEKLRDWLIDIDSMALAEIIRAAEIIEDEKKASISKQHLSTWKELINAISAESFSALYHAFTVQKYADGECIVNQGDIQSTLFLVNSGKVQLHAVCQGKHEAIKILEAGDIFGAETFFEVSVWTIAAKSLGAELFKLPYSPFNKLKENYPALEAKLLEHCGQFQSPKMFFNRTRKTRRLHERKKSSNRVTLTLLDDAGKETGKSAKGDLHDISQGGLSLSFHSSQKKAAGALLGKKIRITIRCDIYSAAIIRTSTVRAIGGHDPIGNRYSMHVEFEKPLAAAEIQQLSNLGKDL